jgi:hypothetical protein
MRRETVVRLSASAICSLAYLLSVGAAAAQDVPRPDVRIGDTWVLERADRRTNTKSEIVFKVVAVGNDDLTVASTEGSTANEQKWSRDLNYVSGDGKRVLKPSSQELNFPLSPGRQWKVNAKGVTRGGGDMTLEGECKVVAFEKITVRAGTFDAFKVECVGEFYVYGARTQGTHRRVYWYSPAVKFPVKSEVLSRDRLTVFNDWTEELVSTTVK